MGCALSTGLLSESVRRFRLQGSFCTTLIQAPELLALRLRNKIPLAILEPIEVRGVRGAGHVLAGEADEGAGEIRGAGGGGFVGEDAGVELLREPLSRGVATSKRVGGPVDTRYGLRRTRSLCS